MKDILTSPRMEDMKRKRRMKRVRSTILVLLLIAVVVIGLSYLSNNSRLIINNVVVTGTRIVDDGAVKDTVKSALSGKYLKLFTRANTLIYPKNKIYKNLITKFPRIEQLSIYRNNLHTLHVDVGERSGSSLYCGAQVPDAVSDIGENCYFVNNDGYIFDKAPYFSGNIYFKYYIPLENSDASSLGKQMLEPDRFHAVERFIDGVTALGFKPNFLVIDPDGDDTLYLNHNPTNTAPTIIFKNKDDINVIFDNLSTAMTKPEFANEIHSLYTTLLYIDLRFGNKVIYKFQ